MEAGDGGRAGQVASGTARLPVRQSLVKGAGFTSRSLVQALRLPGALAIPRRKEQRERGDAAGCSLMTSCCLIQPHKTWLHDRLAGTRELWHRF